MDGQRSEGRRISSFDSVGYILDRVPEANTNYKLLILLHWKLFDKIDIPSALIKSVLESGTNPETINRSKRKIIEKRKKLNEFRQHK